MLRSRSSARCLRLERFVSCVRLGFVTDPTPSTDASSPVSTVASAWRRRCTRRSAATRALSTSKSASEFAVPAAAAAVAAATLASLSAFTASSASRTSSAAGSGLFKSMLQNAGGTRAQPLGRQAGAVRTWAQPLGRCRVRKADATGAT
eukprot:scaffold83479_cov66-Phaeocystis_antarctica.AAC.1